MPKILLVEDNEMNRDMLGRRLQRHGFRLSFAVDAPSGIAMASAELPDLILMDIALGEMDGWEATRLIKANPASLNRCPTPCCNNPTISAIGSII